MIDRMKDRVTDMIGGVFLHIVKMLVIAGSGLCAMVYLLVMYVEYETLFPVVLVLVITPCLLGSVYLLTHAVTLVASRPNTTAISWTDGAFLNTLLSCILQIAAYWAWRRCSVIAVIDFPWPIVPMLFLTSIVTFLWLPPVVVAAIRKRNILHWRGVVGEVQGPEFEKVRNFVDAQCFVYADKYHYSVRLDRAFQVTNPRLECAFDGFRDKLRAKGKQTNRHHLFHGTSRASAMSIVDSGFRLPDRGGMFGKGVYFADTPLKSMNYARRSGVMLLCDVELGNPKRQRSPNSALEPDKNFKRNWFMKAIGKRSYDSVEASAGFLGAVRVPEYVVYRPQQAVPRYILLVSQVRK